MYEIDNFLLSVQIKFESTDIAMNLISRISKEFPKSQEVKGTRLYSYEKKYENGNIKTNEQIEIWKKRANINYGVNEFSNINAVLENAWSFYNQFINLSRDLTYKSFKLIVFSGLNMQEDEVPAHGKDLFSLNYHPFGDEYEVAFIFRWNEFKDFGAPTLVQLLPMSSDSKHIHCNCQIKFTDKDKSYKIETQHLNFFKFVISEVATKISSDVFLGRSTTQ